MIGQTSKQAELASLITRHIAEHGVCPSYEEMKAGLGLKSRSGVHRLVRALEERGIIRRLHKRARAIEIVEHDPFAGVPSAKLIAELHRRGFEISATAAVLAVAA